MLSRSWSLPPIVGLRQRDSSPVDHRRRRRRSKSLSGLEMSREMRKLADHYEKQHKRRLARIRDYGGKVHAMLDTKTKKLDLLEARIQKLTHDDLLDPKDLERKLEEMSKIVEDTSCKSRQDDVVAALGAMYNREDEFANKLEIIRTLQVLKIRRKYDEES